MQQILNYSASICKKLFGDTKNSTISEVFIFLWFCALTSFILGESLIGKGGILVLDFIPTESTFYDFTSPISEQILQGIINLLGYAHGSKIFILGLFALGGIFGWKISALVSRILSNNTSEKVIPLQLRIIGLTFGIVNPLFYERLLTQPTILAGALMFGIGFLELVQKSIEGKGLSNVQSVGIGILFGLSVGFAPHIGIFLAVAVVGLLSFAYVQNKNDIGFFLQGIARNVLIIFCTGILVILPQIYSEFFRSELSGRVAQFGQSHIEAFASNALEPLNTTMTMVGLYGFWGERYSQFILPGDITSLWLVGLAMVLAFSLYGAFNIYLNNRKILVFLGTLGLISIIGAIGIKNPSILGSAIYWLYENSGIYRGMRESQKWVILWLPIFGVFFVGGIASILERLKKKYLKNFLVIVSSMLLFIWTPGLLNGLHGQLFPIEYPEEIQIFRDNYLQSNATGGVLVLPWHAYLACDWTRGKIISNPMDKLLHPVKTTLSDNIEVGKGLYTDTQSKKSIDVEEFILGIHSYKTSALNENTILLMKCGDWNRYKWIKDDPSCKIQSESSTFISYTCNRGTQSAQ